MKIERHALGLLLHARTAAEWRRWLSKNHAKADEAWLVMHTKASGKPFVPYDDAVDVALCYGWIDSVVKPLGEGARAQRYTPRRAGASVSELNRARVRRLVKEKRMTKKGLAALPDVEAWLDPPPLVVPKDIERALRKGKAWQSFRAFPESYQRIRVGWIEMARGRPEVFATRLAHLVKMTAAGKKVGRDVG